MPSVISSTANSPHKKGTKKKGARRNNADGTRLTAKQVKYEDEMAFEHTISRILLYRFEYDIARLFSTHIHYLADEQLPRLITECLKHATPGWVALNATSEDVKDFFRGVLSLDMRQAGERVATKSILWSYTAIRHFAVSHGVHVCGHRPLHSQLLIAHHDQMRAHLRALESPNPPTFSRPPHLGSLDRGYKSLEAFCLSRVRTLSSHARTGGTMATPPEWQDWRRKIRDGYNRMVETLWEIANEINVRGYGLVLREKLTEKWCCLSCLGAYLEVCEPSPRPLSALEDDQNNDNHSHSSKSHGGPLVSTKGKEREWDGRGIGVLAWETASEEDVWKADLDFDGSYFRLYLQPDEDEDVLTIGELMELRYIKAEREKELGNTAFKNANFENAIEHYQNAYQIEPEIPSYQLNLAAAHLKLRNWIAAENACTTVLSQQKSSKAFYRRGMARQMQGRTDEAIQDFKSILEFQPTNIEAMVALDNIQHPPSDQTSYPSPPNSPHAAYSSPASCSHRPKLQYSPTPANKQRPQPLKLNERPIPWEVHDLDRVKLRLRFLPLTVHIDPNVGKESFSYPSWSRYQVMKG